MSIFGKKSSNVTNQIKLKEDLVKTINNTLYKLEKKKFESDEDAKRIDVCNRNIRNAMDMLNDSVGSSDSDISVGCKKVKQDLDLLAREMKGSIISNMEDAYEKLEEDIVEIVDLQEGNIDLIEEDETQEVMFNKKVAVGLKTIDDILLKLNENETRVNNEINKLNRNKQELNKKLIKESDNRKAAILFKEIKAMDKSIAFIAEKNRYYSSCKSLVDAIKVYVEELVNTASISNVNIDKLKIIAKIKELKAVIDDPSKAKPILRLIKDEIQDQKKSREQIEKSLNDTFDIQEEDLNDVLAYKDSLIAEENGDKFVDDTLSEIEEYKKQLESENL